MQSDWRKNTVLFVGFVLPIHHDMELHPTHPNVYATSAHVKFKLHMVGNCPRNDISANIR